MANSTIRATIFALLAAFLTVGGSAQDVEGVEEGSALAPTLVKSQLDVQRLESVQGVTLQWIGWEERGDVEITKSGDGHWWLRGGQTGDGGASLKLEGFLMEIGEGYFLFDGRITITGTPDANRLCDQHKVWRFEATNRRAYYRLREFEWCDYLTDYIDVYFAPGLR